MYDDEDDNILDELHEEKASFRTVLNRKKLTKWEMDETFLGEI